MRHKSQDDAEEKLLADYLRSGVLRQNTLDMLVDRDGVRELLAMVQERCGEANLKLGARGEHGGDPQSIGFFHPTGLDCVSYSPFRVSGTRLARRSASRSVRRVDRPPDARVGSHVSTRMISEQGGTP